MLNTEEKSVILRGNKKAAHKTSLLQMEEKLSKSKNFKKLSNKFKKGVEEFNDMGSLIFLKDVTKRKKLSGIDERIKLLKSELKSLLGDKKPDKDCNFFANNKNDVVCTDLINIGEISQMAPKVLDSNYRNSSGFCKESLKSDINNFKPSTSSVPPKFSEWLDKTIDEMNSKSEIEENNAFKANNIPLNSKLQLDYTENSKSLDFNVKSKFCNMSLLPEDQVEKLLYKSFVMQNSEIYLSSSEDSGQEYIKPTSKVKQQKYRRSKKCKKSQKERLVQSNLSKNCTYSRKGRKRRLINRNSFTNEIEVVDLDYSLSNSSLGNEERPKMNCEVLDIDDYDWNETFDLDEGTGVLSDKETTDNCRKNNMKLNNQNLKFSYTKMLESEQSVCYDGESKVQQKKVWECPVCFEQSKGQEVVATQCGHIFCRSCIENHSSKLGKSCPSCRSDLRDKQLITLFNF